MVESANIDTRFTSSMLPLQVHFDCKFRGIDAVSSRYARTLGGNRTVAEVRRLLAKYKHSYVRVHAGVPTILWKAGVVRPDDDLTCKCQLRPVLIAVPCCCPPKCVMLPWPVA